MIDYIAIMQEYHGGRNDGFLTDQPIEIKFSDDDYVRVRYDATAMRWIANRPSRIKYPTAKQLIREYRKEYKRKEVKSMETEEPKEKERVNLGKFETDFLFAKEMLFVASYLFDDIHPEEKERELLGGIHGIIEVVYQRLDAISAEL